MTKKVPIWAVIVVLVALLGIRLALSDIKIDLSVQIGPEEEQMTPCPPVSFDTSVETLANGYPSTLNFMLASIRIAVFRYIHV